MCEWDNFKRILFITVHNVYACEYHTSYHWSLLKVLVNITFHIIDPCSNCLWISHFISLILAQIWHTEHHQFSDSFDLVKHNGSFIFISIFYPYSQCYWKRTYDSFRTETPWLVTVMSLVEASTTWWELESWSWAAGISGGGCRSLASCSVRHCDWGCSPWCLSEWPFSLLARTSCPIYPGFRHCSNPQCGVWTVHVIPLEMWCSWGGDVLPGVVPRCVPSPYKKQDTLHIVSVVQYLSFWVYKLLPQGVDGLKVHSHTFFC